MLFTIFNPVSVWFSEKNAVFFFQIHGQILGSFQLHAFSNGNLYYLHWAAQSSKSSPDNNHSSLAAEPIQPPSDYNFCMSARHKCLASPTYSFTWGKHVQMSFCSNGQAPPALVPRHVEKSKRTVSDLSKGRAGQQLRQESRNYDRDQCDAMCSENCSTVYTEELHSQWLLISHIKLCKQPVCWQCIFLKPGDLGRVSYCGC